MAILRGGSSEVKRTIIIFLTIQALLFFDGCDDTQNETKLESDSRIALAEDVSKMQTNSSNESYQEPIPDTFGVYEYMRPSDFPGLPQPIASWLELRDYLIPQVLSLNEYANSPDLRYQNAIIGEFSKVGQQDWAVYCSKENNAVIILFYNQDSLDYQILKFLPDSQGIRCCDLQISRAENYMIKDEPNYVKSKASYPIIDHDGIYIATATYPLDLIYKNKGKWIRFTPSYD